MALDRAEICRRLSPHTFFRQWLKECYSPWSFRGFCQRASVICIACAFHQTSRHAILLYLFASMAMLCFRIPLDRLWFTIDTLPKVAKFEIQQLNYAVIAEILEKEKSEPLLCLFLAQEYSQKIRAAKEQGYERSGIRLLEPIQAVEAKIRSPSRPFLRQSLKPAEAKLKWLQAFKARLERKAEHYIHLYGQPLACDQTRRKDFDAFANSYASFVLEAISRPFSFSLEQAA